ncbi:MAG: hypothetical protein K2M17_05800 [Bacilli bacterium]|nr:hypothetical protein [Bacilli bacterium]
MKEKNLTIKKTLPFIIIATILGIGLGYLSYAYFSEKQPLPEEKNVQEEITQLINEINEFNADLTKENIDEKLFYNRNKDEKCYKYKGKYKDDAIKKLTEMYINPFLSDSPFVINDRVESGKLMLYVCLNPNEAIEQITDYTITENVGEGALININTTSVSMGIFVKQIDGKWKVDEPLLITKTITN